METTALQGFRSLPGTGIEEQGAHAIGCGRAGDSLKGASAMALPQWDSPWPLELWCLLEEGTAVVSIILRQLNVTEVMLKKRHLFSIRQFSGSGGHWKLLNKIEFMEHKSIGGGRSTAGYCN